jgi:hypothetical protein
VRLGERFELRERDVPGFRAAAQELLDVVFPCGRVVASCRLLEQRHDLVVTDLAEVHVPAPDGAERTRLVNAGDIVHLVAQERHGLPGADGNGGDHAPGASRPCPACRGDHRRTGGEPVVDEQDRPASNRDGRKAVVQAPVEIVGPALRGGDGGLDLGLREPVVGTYVRDAARRDRSDGVLRLPRVPDLADGERIERRA